MTTYLALAVLLAPPTAASAYAAGGVAAKKGAAQPTQLWRHDLASATRCAPTLNARRAPPDAVFHNPPQTRNH